MKIRSAPIVTFAVGTWFVLMMVPYLTATSWEQYQRINASPTITYQVIGIIGVCALSLLTLRQRIIRYFLDLNVYQKFFIAFCIYTSITSLVSVSAIDSLIFSAIHFLIFVVFIGIWKSDELAEKYLSLLAVGIFLFLLIAWAVLGVRFRSLGFIPPNDVAKLALVAAVFSMLGRRSYSVLWNALSVLVILFTESRGTLLSLFLFYFVYFVVLRPSYVKVMISAGVLSLGSVVLLTDQLGGGGITRWISDRVLLLDDATRGLGSGFTGRADYWNAGWAAFAERPLLGYGLRTRAPIATADNLTVNAHSGIINMLLDVGLLGAVILMLAFAFAVLVHTRHIIRDGSDLSNRSRVAVSFFAAAIVLWVFEPIYINIGSHISIALLILLAAPPSRASLSVPIVVAGYTSR